MSPPHHVVLVSPTHHAAFAPPGTPPDPAQVVGVLLVNGELGLGRPRVVNIEVDATFRLDLLAADENEARKLGPVALATSARRWTS